MPFFLIFWCKFTICNGYVRDLGYYRKKCVLSFLWFAIRFKSAVLLAYILYCDCKITRVFDHYYDYFYYVSVFNCNRINFILICGFCTIFIKILSLYRYKNKKIAFQSVEKILIIIVVNAAVKLHSFTNSCEMDLPIRLSKLDHYYSR